jgi:hypothetical protein
VAARARADWLFVDEHLMVPHVLFCFVLFITCRGGCQMFGAWLELGREHLRHAGEVAMCGVGAWTSSRIIRGVWVVT